MAGEEIPKGLAWLPIGDDPVGRYVALRENGSFLRDADGEPRYFVKAKDALAYREQLLRR